MDTLLLVLAAMAGVTAGPIVVTRLTPNRVKGDATAGECGASPVFVGVPLGLAFFYLVLALLILFSPPTLTDLPTKLQIVAIAFAALGVICAPILICALHRWTWTSTQLAFAGVFRRRLVQWKDVVSITVIPHTGWTVRTSDKTKLSVTNYVPGHQQILQSLLASRPDLVAAVNLAFRRAGE